MLLLTVGGLQIRPNRELVLKQFQLINVFPEPGIILYPTILMSHSIRAATALLKCTDAFVFLCFAITVFVIPVASRFS